MGRPLNKRYFGSGVSGHEIKVTAKVGDSAVGEGFIVRQRGTRKFIVNVGGEVGVCRLVDKAAGALQAGEMIINVLTDANTVSRVTKLYNRTAIVNGVKVRWNFSSSLTDAAVQVADADEPEVVQMVITMVTQPASVTVAAGEPASFTAEASITSGTVVYQWQENVGGEWTPVTGANTSTFTIESTVEADTGREFRVVVSADGVESVVSDAATLTVTA